MTSESAFPVPVSADKHGGLNYGTPGMSLREYYAGQALASLAGYYSNLKPHDVAKKCYELADAMIAARGWVS